MLKLQIAKKNAFEAVKAVLDKRLISGTWSDLSCLVEGEIKTFAITPKGIDYDKLKVQDLLIINMAGEIIEGEHQKSAETSLHTTIYKARPDVKVIIHTQSEYCTAFSMARKPIPATCTDMVTVVGGDVRVANYGTPGSRGLAHSALRALGPFCKAVLLANDGLLCVGSNVKEAVKVAQVCERTAQSVVLARTLGGAVSLSGEQIAEIKKGAVV